MAIKARKSFGLYESNYLLLLEGRLASVVYRSIFLSNMFEILNCIKQNLVSVNKVFIPQPNFLVKLFDLITFHSSLMGWIHNQLILRLRKRAVLFNRPKYMFISYIFIFCFMKKLPLKKELVFPAFIDVNRLAGYIN